MCLLVVSVSSSCGSDEGLPTMPLDLSGSDGTVETPRTVDELIKLSYVVARGRFVGGPTVVQTSRDGENLITQQQVWEFVPDEVYRDVRLADAPTRIADEQRGSLLIGATVNDVATMRGGESVDKFVRTRPSTYNLNSFPVDRPVIVFLRPGKLPREVIEQDPELANTWIMAAPGHCFTVAKPDESCAYVADRPGGEPLARVERGALVPRGLTLGAIKNAGSVTEVVQSEFFAEVQPVDAQRYAVISGIGVED